jgi:hypothetical protein
MLKSNAIESTKISLTLQICGQKSYKKNPFMVELFIFFLHTHVVKTTKNVC